MNWKFLNSGLNSGRFNMDFDLFLSENIEPDNVYLRLYQWHPCCISFGNNLSEDELDLKKAKYNMIDVVKRPTGGSAFMHAMELTYSVIYSINDNILRKNFNIEINTAIRNGLIMFDSKLSETELKNNLLNSNEFNIDEISDVSSMRTEIYLNEKKTCKKHSKKI
ncbi:MAG: hypothetical protein M5U17_01700 [Ignavibacterium sp.]|nr:hypothetical protein [Ignavibacterium sp.]